MNENLQGSELAGAIVQEGSAEPKQAVDSRHEGSQGASELVRLKPVFQGQGLFSQGPAGTYSGQIVCPAGDSQERRGRSVLVCGDAGDAICVRRSADVQKSYLEEDGVLFVRQGVGYVEKSLCDGIEEGLDVARSVSPLVKVTEGMFGSFMFLDDVLRLDCVSTAGHLTCETRLGGTQALDDRSTR